MPGQFMGRGMGGLMSSGAAASSIPLTGLELWLKADTLALNDGDAVSTWPDSSGKGRDATGSGATRPIYKTNIVNGKPVLRHTAQYLTIANSQAAFKFLHYLQATVFVVAKTGVTANPEDYYPYLGSNAIDATNIGYFLFHDDRSSIGGRNNILASGLSRGLSQYRSLNITANGFHAVQTWEILSDSIDGANATASERSAIRLNNGSPIKNNAQTYAASTADAAFPLDVGAGGNGVAPFKGDTAEYIIYSSVLSDADRALVLAYLSAKYAIALA